MARKAAASPEVTGEYHDTRWKPGMSGNPAGRPVGVRNKLSELFLINVANHFAKHGTEALDRCFQENPTGYLTIISRIMPRQIEAAVEVADRFNTQDLLPDQRRRIAENWLLSTAVETAPDGVEQAY